ncbi:MAG: 2-C-methyl-D-erythritol 4-phosphate cytidylyltransferase, partial [Candidatus Diapherotrites archaeon]|nr:2-C-methyl-D-erythritol 4-phosphate cytidylyltransferase [Candidatus Diapherotrites archaeon]
MPENVALILAAGLGKRMKANKNKVLLELNGKPIIEHTLDAFQKSKIDAMILVVNERDMEFMKEIAKKYDKIIDVVLGGKERQDSALNGILAAEKIKAEKVYLQDGARCLITPELINKIIDVV